MKCFVVLLHSFSNSLPEAGNRLVLLVKVNQKTLLVIRIENRFDVPRALLQVTIFVQLNEDLSITVLGLRKQ